MPFSYSDLPDLSGKTFIITGSTSGLGKSQAHHLAKHKAHVIIVGRSEPKVQEVVQFIQTDTGNLTVEGMIADLTDLKSVIKFCDSFLSRETPLYSLTLNAATLSDRIELTPNGIETQWQTNVLSQYMLCMRLLPALKKSPEARIVVVSSRMHTYITSRFPLTNEYINSDPSYGKLKRYGETKCANVQFARFLAKHLKESGHDKIFVNSLHPGVVATKIYNHFSGLVRFISWWFLTAPDNGAKTQTYLSASPEVSERGYRGEYFVPDAKLAQAAAVASDDENGNELIKFLESQLKSVLST